MVNVVIAQKFKESQTYEIIDSTLPKMAQFTIAKSISINSYFEFFSREYFLTTEGDLYLCYEGKNKEMYLIDEPLATQVEDFCILGRLFYNSVSIMILRENNVIIMENKFDSITKKYQPHLTTEKLYRENIVFISVYHFHGRLAIKVGVEYQ